jgi:hypothetical protein
MKTREEWTEIVFDQLRNMVAFQDVNHPGKWEDPKALAAVVRGAMRHFLEGNFDTHDALRMVCAMVTLIREVQLREEAAKANVPPS